MAVIKKENWMDIVDIVREKVSDLFPPLTCFAHAAICPVGIISSESISIIEVYHRSGGFTNSMPYQEYLSMPNIVVELFCVIENELNRIKKIREEGSNG